MNKLAVFAVAFAALAMTAGCGFKESDLVGTWIGKVVLSEEDKKTPGAEADAARAAFGLDIKDDKTFAMSVMGESAEGTWTYAEAKLTLTMTKVGGTDISSIPGAAENNKPKVLNVEEGGKKMTLSDATGTSKTVVEFTMVPKD